ncbi:unnamed protein product [Arctia plantaginis]|uniref:Solute carrier organic anion transporter family member n=1 Tax=Arctia plantaginis TaxID=874455 RepID=A0A8S1A4X4_ARCPL|nr:unnamed protein product [Arctia plantaginis]
MTASTVAKVSAAAGDSGTPGPATEDAAMKGVEATPEEQERLAVGNNNGSLDCKHTAPRPQPIGHRSVFHSTRVFMLVFLSGWVLQGMFLTYFVSVTTTVEKLFKVESKTTGTLLAATEIGQICTALFLTYLAGRGHRPRWIACMMLVLAVGVIGCVMPHVFYGTKLLDVHLDAHRAGAAPVCHSAQNSSMCDDEHVKSRDTRSNITAVVIPWLFICLLVVGVGQTGIATLGIPYVDDNVGSKQSPLYMAITIGIRVIGPALGFLLGALCTRVYVDPLLQPDFDASDPRWVGAWWLGMVFIASFIVILATLMFCFPRQIKQEPLSLPAKKNKDKRQSFFKDFFATIKRQLTNDILMWRTASSVLHLMPISGVYSFLPKYLEKQFRLPTHDANLVSGLGGILVMGLGTITSGVIILKLVPSAKQVAAWTAASAAIYSAGMIVLMFVSCPEENYAMISEGTIANSGLDCSSGCNCTNVPFNPVCGQDSFTYLSPCQAGCLDSHQLDNNTWLYTKCSCIKADGYGDKALATLDRYSLHNTSSDWSGDLGFAVSGECKGPCNQIYTFVAVFAAIMFVHASGEVGAVLLIIRCTDKQDKAMAMGVIQFAIGVFGNVPCPIVFGAAVDAACRARDVLCNVLGACVSYDNDSFRHFYLASDTSTSVRNTCACRARRALQRARRLRLLRQRQLPTLLPRYVTHVRAARDVLCNVLGACVSYDNDSFRHFYLASDTSTTVRNTCACRARRALQRARRLRLLRQRQLPTLLPRYVTHVRAARATCSATCSAPASPTTTTASDTSTTVRNTCACRARRALQRARRLRLLRQRQLPTLLPRYVTHVRAARDVLCNVLGACVSYDNDSFRHFYLASDTSTSVRNTCACRARRALQRARRLRLLRQRQLPTLLPRYVTHVRAARDVLCNELGACVSYDNDSFRHFYLGLSATLMFLAFIMDLLVWSKAGRIDMNPAEACSPDAEPFAPRPAPPAPAPALAPAPVPPGDTQL